MHAISEPAAPVKTNTVAIPYLGLDSIRIQAEIETADRKKTKRPTWAPAVPVARELLDLCRELEYLGDGDKPVARLWAIFNSPSGRGKVIRNTFSKHPLEGMACRGFEMRAGEDRSGGLMARALMDEDGHWATALGWGHGLSLSRLQHNAAYFERCIKEAPRRLESKKRPEPRHASEEQAIATIRARYADDQLGARESFIEYCAQSEIASDRRALERWTEREQQIRDPQFIASVHKDIETNKAKLAKTLREIAKVEVNPNWFHDTHTRMTALATARMLEYAGDLEPQRRKGAQVTGCCCICGRELTDPVSVERGIGPECIKCVRTFNIRDLVRLKAAVVASHPDKGGTNEAFREAFAKYEAAKEAAKGSLTYGGAP